MQCKIRHQLLNTINENKILLDYYDSLYITGGFVRDYLHSKFHNSNFEFKDYDFCTSQNILLNESIKLSSIEKKYLFYIISDNITLNSFRKDVNCYGRKADVQYSDFIEDDIARRDFNINSIYYDIKKDIFIDLHNGINDIQYKKFKFIGNSEIRIQEDKTRLLRKDKLINMGYEYYE